MEKDYSLLRQFDREAAKRGEPICYRIDGSKRIYMTGPDNANHLCVEDPADGRFVLAHVDKYRMSPLAWVEGKPVYKGDVLWYKDYNFSIQVDGLNDYDPDNGLKGLVVSANYPNPAGYKGGELTWAPFDKWSWTPTKVKKEAWVNVYKNSNNAYRHDTKEKADANARMMDGTIDPNRIACVRLEWDE